MPGGTVASLVRLMLGVEQEISHIEGFDSDLPLQSIPGKPRV